MRVYCTTQGLQPIYYNYKWNVAFKNCESLYCTPVTFCTARNYSQKKEKRFIFGRVQFYKVSSKEEQRRSPTRSAPQEALYCSPSFISYAHTLFVLWFCFLSNCHSLCNEICASTLKLLTNHKWFVQRRPNPLGKPVVKKCTVCSGLF